MYKAFVFLFLLILLSCPAGRTIGQVRESQPANETKTEARRLLEEGIEFTGAGQFAEAVSSFEAAIKLDPQYAEAYAALGRAYFKMREWRRAVDNLHHAAALNARQKQAKTAQPLPTPHPVSASILLQKVPEPGTTGSKTLTSLAMKLNAIEAPLQTPLEVPVDEKATGEVAPLKSYAASEEAQEATGVNVSMSASPASSTVESRTVNPISLKASSEDLSLTKIYRVGPGDVLDVRINQAQPQQSTLFTVTPAGLLEHPLLAEPLNVSALTTEEIVTKLQADFKQRALIENPEVTVGIRDYASHSILVSGLVKESGTRFLRREAIPLYVVVADAQPLPEAAKVTVVRNELNQMFEIDLTKVADMNLLVRSGDVVNLQRNETQFVYVGGEVKDPGEKIFRRGLTLTQAIISAGGMTPKSKVAEIGRDDGEGFLVKTSFKLKDIQTGKAMDPLIRPGDRIMIIR